MKAYINGIGSVSPQEFSQQQTLLGEASTYEAPFLQIAPPDYKKFIDPKQLRRMSKVIRMGMVSALVAMKDAGIDHADSIITATGMGCQADTEKFLNAMLENDEGLLNPTAFIHSTHNTIGAQIALLLGNHNYNFTYVHRSFSFESTLLDALMQLNEKTAKNILVGGIDEITEESWKIKTQIGFYKKEAISNMHLLKDPQQGALAGEGSAFFMLSSEPSAHTYASIDAVSTFFRPEDQHETEHKIADFIRGNGIQAEDIDLVLLGYNGDPAFDPCYDAIEANIFTDHATACFKPLCGEYDTASSFALWMAATIIKTGSVPALIMHKGTAPVSPKKILIYNQFRNINHSLILLSA